MFSTVKHVSGSPLLDSVKTLNFALTFPIQTTNISSEDMEQRELSQAAGSMYQYKHFGKLLSRVYQS